ncbi:pyridoxal-dependent decarboxylase [Aestuariivita sp.]|jgi:aromatic-L-amino-acid decarboxylase|uniref:pyridoxal phosphate-dependent decarboxylase family protein n=1 Tax=Aestuariivita sp. TaxID=1872407 RepID=UPI00216F7BFD|nr:pyridoxal-dependent decarboxylase [Aestuariivita sp.]MCE8007644.1 aspartate aminotransferase family protein [Aestuariivita sp.]
MNWDDFADWSQKAARWGAEYHKTLRDRPVRAQVGPGDTLAQLPDAPPEKGQPLEDIWTDFQDIVMPGITHWQHPRFFAYFNSNAAPASVLAEFLASIVAPQCMLWQTSPSATEMETRMMDWLIQALGLPSTYSGVIQDSASSATLAAVLTMRERALSWAGNQKGLPGQKTLRIYCSDQVHSSIDRAIWVAGIGQENLIKIPTKGPMRAMDTEALQAAITADRAAGYLPAGIIAATGATGMGACDDMAAVADVAERESLYTHLDAAWAGAAMICPEFRPLWAGAERFDSIVFNPHKWLGAQFDCAAHFLRDPDLLRQTLAIRPEYLKTHGAAEVTDYSEWSIPLGRRFRALKLWFLIRTYGLEGLRARIRNHVVWSQALCDRLRAEPDFEIVTDPILSLWTFRVKGADDAATQALVDAINDDGRIYITQTLVDGTKVIRFQAGQFDCIQADFDTAFDTITQIARAS